MDLQNGVFNKTLFNLNREKQKFANGKNDEENRGNANWLTRQKQKTFRPEYNQSVAKLTDKLQYAHERRKLFGEPLLVFEPESQKQFLPFLIN